MGAWLVAARWHVFGLPQPPLPAGWMHAIIMQYQVLPSFIFGFLLTVFPRWLGLPALTPRHYLPVGVGLFGGQLLTLAGLAGSPSLLRAGALFTIAGWSIGMFWLARLRAGAKAQDMARAVVRSRSLRPRRAWRCYLLLTASRRAVAVRGHQVRRLRPAAAIYFTVCHRMIPFFANWWCAVYRLRPLMWLGAPGRAACTWGSSCATATRGCGSRTRRSRC